VVLASRLPGFKIFGGGKKKKGWMQTTSYTDGDDDGIRLNQQGGRPYSGHHANESTASVGVHAPGRVYDDPFNAASMDNLQKQNSAQIDHGPEYHRVNTGAERAMSPPPFAGGTRFKESL
jgi:hypothetical protein